MLVSVVIPTYNCASFLREAIQSVQSQDYKNTEIIVVDDGSTDNTDEVLKPFLDTITVIKQTNQGVSSARNNGISHAQGDFIAFLDADDFWHPGKLSLQMKFLSENPDIAGVFSDFGLADETGNITDTSYIKDNYPIFSTYNLTWEDLFSRKIQLCIETDPNSIIDAYSGNIFQSLFLGNYISTDSLVLKRSILSKSCLFNPERKTQEDYELWLKIAKNNELGYIDKPLLYYRRREGQLTGQENSTEINQVSLEIIENIALGASGLLPDKKLVAARLRDKYWNLALNYLGSNQKRAARKCLRKSLSYNYLDKKTLSLYLWSFLPYSIDCFIRKFRRSY